MSVVSITLGTEEGVEAGTGRVILGKQETTISLDIEGMSMADILSTVEATAAVHMGGNPLWVDCDDVAIRGAICGMFKISKTKKRPAAWLWVEGAES